MVVGTQGGSIVGLQDGLSGSLGGTPNFNTDILLHRGTPHENVQHSVLNGSQIAFDVVNQEFYIQTDSDSGSSWTALKTV